MMRNDAWTLRVLVLCTGLATSGAARAGDEPKPAPAAVKAATVTDEFGAEGKVWRILCAPATQVDVTAGAATARIVKLGNEALPVVLGILTGSITEPALPPDFVIHPELIERRQEILESSLRAFPHGAVLSAIRAFVGAEAAIDVVLLAVQLAGKVGKADALDLVFELAAALEPIHYERAYVQSAIEGAITSILQSDQSAYRRLPRSLGRASRQLLPLAIAATGDAGSAAGLPVLIAHFGKDDELDRLLIEEIGELAESSYTEIPQNEIARLLRFADHPDVQLARGAAKALGRLGEASAFPNLIALLEHTDKRVVAAAQWSLKQLSRQDFATNAAEWTRWYQAQADWREAEFAPLLQKLRSGNPGEVVHALGKLVVHPLYKHEAARELCASLDAGNPGLARTTCSVLGQLGSTRAVPTLVDLLDAPDEALRLQAADSLRLLTGHVLPAEREPWSKALRL